MFYDTNEGKCTSIYTWDPLITAVDLYFDLMVQMLNPHHIESTDEIELTQ